MQFIGLYNLFGVGTEVILGQANEELPSRTETVTLDPLVLFSGQITNLSRHLVHLGLHGLKSDGTTDLHRHDIRAYESLNIHNVPLSRIDVYVPTGIEVGIHGMAVLTRTEDEDERAVALTKTGLFESLHQSPDFMIDVFNNNVIAAIATTTIWTPAANSTIGIYRVNIACDAAQTVQLQFTDALAANARVIGLYRFTAAGTYTVDFDTALIRNPHGNDGLLQAITTTAASTQIDSYGHDILFGQ